MAAGKPKLAANKLKGTLDFFFEDITDVLIVVSLFSDREREREREREGERCSLPFDFN